MILKNIKIKNFRQYQNEEIQISGTDDKKNFTIIQGMNGSGKSNLLNAITWCLYGKEHHRTAKYTGLPIVNTVTNKELSVGEISQVEVQLKMLDNGKLIDYSEKI